MKQLRNRILDIFKKGDMILLSLCAIATIFGIVMIYSVTMDEDNTRYIIIQTGTLFAGVLIYLAMTAFDIEILAGQRTLMFLFNVLLIGALLVFGVEGDTGNLGWLQLPFLPFNIQPAEICKITLIIILAKTMSVNQTRISSYRNVLPMTFHAIFLFVFYVAISRDMGVALIFIFIFAGMAFLGGVKGWWFVAAIGAIVVLAPTFWEHGLDEYQRDRFAALYDPSIDPLGIDERWQIVKNLDTLKNGGVTGLGLFNGKLGVTDLPANHTDSIFSAIGEQLGMFGCLFVLLILLAIVARIIYIGAKSPDFMNRMICMGIATMFLFQILVNIGVCLSVVPVIGLALPFISYGGSSIITSFLAMGIVSGIKMRPAPDISAHYIRPY